MIDPFVEHLSSKLIQYSNDLLGTRSAYRLDFSLPSLSTIDILLNTHLLPKKLTPHDHELIKGSAAYLGIMAYSTWQLMEPRPRLKLVTRTEPDLEIILEARSGPLCEENEVISISLIQCLRTILEKPQNPFPCFEFFQVPLESGLKIISLFGKGLLSGLSPYLDGPWSKVSTKDHAYQLHLISNFLAIGTSEHFAFRFSQNRFLTSPELFFNALIFPPPGYDEPYPGIRSTAALINFLKKNEASPKEIEQLCLQLLMTPDDSYNMLGYIISVALEIKNLQSMIVAYATSKINIIRKYRAAVHLAKKLYDKPYSYIHSLTLENSSFSLPILQHEYDTGLFLLLSQRPSIEFIDFPPIVLENLATGSFPEARTACETYSALTVTHCHTWIQLQKMYLQILQGEDIKSELSELGEVPDFLKESQIKTTLELALLKNHLDDTILHLSSYMKILDTSSNNRRISPNDAYLLNKVSAKILHSGDIKKISALESLIMPLLTQRPELLSPALYAMWSEYFNDNNKTFPNIPDSQLFILERAYWTPLTAYTDIGHKRNNTDK
jgi:hypothetical protein